MKKLLIISPYFPPVNAADMQRIRMSLSYFKEFLWEAEVVIVDDKYTDISIDPLLLETIPDDIKIHKVRALDKRWTSKLGLGSIALRSLWFYKKKVNGLLRTGTYDLIYFSTTQFPVCILGSYWKRHFGVPYVIDMQDPWHSDYYEDKPTSQRPAKYWFSYRLNKYLEPIAMKSIDGLVSVSQDYIATIKNRYPQIKHVPSATITFASFEPDMKIARDNKRSFKNFLDKDTTNIVYIGRGGGDLHKAIIPVFKTLRNNNSEFKKLKLYFVGTSYAAAGQGKPTIMSLAKEYGVDKQVIEITDRISYYHTLFTLLQADGLFVPGSDDPKYTASKIYPYLLTSKPLLAIFNAASSALRILKEFGAEYVYDYDHILENDITKFFRELLNQNEKSVVYNSEVVVKYSAKQMTERQCILFNSVLNGKV